MKLSKTALRHLLYSKPQKGIFINRRRNGYDQGPELSVRLDMRSGAARLLLQREDVEIVWYGSRSVGEDFASIYRNTAHAVNEPRKDDDMANWQRSRM